MEAADRLGKELIEAVEEKDIDKVNRLLQEGADVNFKGDDEYSVLMFAALNRSETPQESVKNANIVRLLLARGADINARDETGFTALRFACAENNIEIVKVLLEANNPPADPNTQDDTEERTALHAASQRGHVEIVTLLLTLNNIDVSIKDENGMTAKQLANMRGNADIVGLLEQSEQKKQRMGGRRRKTKRRHRRSKSKKQGSRRR